MVTYLCVNIDMQKKLKIILTKVKDTHSLFTKALNNLQDDTMKTNLQILIATQVGKYQTEGHNKCKVKEPNTMLLWYPT